MLSLMTAIVLAGFAIAVPDAPPHLDDATVDRVSRILLKRSGISEMEVAAFIVRPDNGPAVLVHWPGVKAHRRAVWRGPVPDNTIAVIHTHPHLVPQPSPQDVSEARRLRLPFYVVSRRNLFVVGPDGRIRKARTIPWLAKDRAVDMRWHDLAL